jgi:Mrp family chromosome partitioning ATPase
VAIWDPGDSSKAYAEGLRERVSTYFEAHELDLKKPKLVALTGVANGVGVSTLASTLATELSKTGDENVLLLDMNREPGAAHPFFMGKLEPGVSDVVTPASRAEAKVQEKLYVISQGKKIDAELTALLSKRFNYLVPKLTATNYGYIVFDLPPVSPSNSTARLASHMDLTLMILESERTGQKAAAQAKELMHKSHANLVIVLNKCRRHVLGSWSKDL